MSPDRARLSLACPKTIFSGHMPFSQSQGDEPSRAALGQNCPHSPFYGDGDRRIRFKLGAFKHGECLGKLVGDPALKPLNYQTDTSQFHKKIGASSPQIAASHCVAHRSRPTACPRLGAKDKVRSGRKTPCLKAACLK